MHKSHRPEPLKSVEEVIGFISEAYFFFVESYKSKSVLEWIESEPVLDWLVENYPQFSSNYVEAQESDTKELREDYLKSLKKSFVQELTEFREKLVKFLHNSRDVRAKLVNQREKVHDPVTCFIAAINALHHNSNSFHLQDFLIQNENFTNFLAEYLPKIAPIIVHWNEENHEFIQQIYKPENNTADNNNELKTFAKCMVAQFIIENRNFLILSSLKFVIQNTSLFSIYEDWLKSNKNIAESQQEFRNQMILEPFIYNLKSFLDKENEEKNFTKFIDLIFNGNREDLETFLNGNDNDSENRKQFLASINKFLAGNLPTLIPLIEEFNGKPNYKATKDNIAEMIAQNASLIYSIIAFTIFQGELCDEEMNKLIDEQSKLYQKMMDNHGSVILNFEADFTNFLLVSEQEKKGDNSLATNFVNVIKDLYDNKAGSWEALKNLLCKEPSLANFFVQNLSIQTLIQHWNKNVSSALSNNNNNSSSETSSVKEIGQSKPDIIYLAKSMEKGVLTNDTSREPLRSNNNPNSSGEIPELMNQDINTDEKSSHEQQRMEPQLMRVYQ